MNEQLTLDLQPVQEVYRIPLTQGQFALVDAADFAELSKWKWYAFWNPFTRSYYARRNFGRDSKGNQMTVHMSRQIMNATKGEIIDHRDHDTLNNRRSNLRRATRAQNCQNARKRRDNKYGFKGIFKTNKKWLAHIRENGKFKHLGVFSSPEAAHAAYAKAALELHGEFACLK